MAEIQTVKQAQLVFMDEDIIAFVQEIRNHPKLVEEMEAAEKAGREAHSLIFELQGEDQKDVPMINNFEEAIGFVAAHLGILMEGLYDYESICRLCRIMRQKLEDKRCVVLNSSPIILPDNMK